MRKLIKKKLLVEPSPRWLTPKSSFDIVLVYIDTYVKANTKVQFIRIMVSIRSVIQHLYAFHQSQYIHPQNIKIKEHNFFLWLVLRSIRNGRVKKRKGREKKLTSWYCFNCRKEAATGVRCYCYCLTAIQLLDHCWRTDNLVVLPLLQSLSFLYTLPKPCALTLSVPDVRSSYSNTWLLFLLLSCFLNTLNYIIQYHNIESLSHIRTVEKRAERLPAPIGIDRAFEFSTDKARVYVW